MRILLADDHPVVRGGLRALIDTIDGLEVVGEAATARRRSARSSCLGRTSS